METLQIRNESPQSVHSSYRTYEEWKHSSKDFNLGTLFVSSYRTYEEWKRNPTIVRYKNN